MNAEAESLDHDPVEKSRMTLGEHLDELRVRLIRSVLGLCIVFAAGWVVHERIAQIVIAPAVEKAIPWLNELMLERITTKLVAEGLPSQDSLELEFRDGPWLDGFEERLAASPLASGEALSPAQLSAVVGDKSAAVRHLVRRIPEQLRADASAAGMVFYLKVCFYFALFLGGPYVLWQLWAFIAAGLYRHEKGVVYRYAPFSMGLFLAGVVFGYFYMVPYAQYFLAEMGIEQFQYDLRLELYLNFFTKLSLGLGIVFQLPILMIVLARVGLVEPAAFSKYRGHFWISALIIAAVLTPPDPYTQVMMAGPMAVLYEVGILLAKIAARKARSTALVEAEA
jgi:Tat protein translocase TatC